VTGPIHADSPCRRAAVFGGANTSNRQRSSGGGKRESEGKEASAKGAKAPGCESDGAGQVEEESIVAREGDGAAQEFAQQQQQQRTGARATVAPTTS
jgi:hypothetical protein